MTDRLEMIVPTGWDLTVKEFIGVACIVGDVEEVASWQASKLASNLVGWQTWPQTWFQTWLQTWLVVHRTNLTSNLVSNLDGWYTVQT